MKEVAASRIDVIVADITTLKVDAIVNAANEGLRGGGGVDGAIQREAGPKLLEAGRAIGHCPTGQAVLNDGFELPAGHVIHTVGPVWRGGNASEADLLASAYRSSLAIAKEKQFGTIAFPAISTGVYGYPKREAAEIAVSTATSFCRASEWPKRIVFCCFDEETARLHRDALARLSD